MKSITDYILESKASVSFGKKWNDEGTTFDQRVTLHLTEDELKALNTKLKRKTIVRRNKDGGADSSKVMNAAYLEKDLPLKYGDNFLHLVTSNIIKTLGIEGTERMKDRNTLLVIKK